MELTDKQIKQLGWLAFIYHDRYGLPRSTIWRTIAKIVGWDYEQDVKKLVEG